MTMSDIASFAAAFGPDIDSNKSFHLGVLAATSADGTCTVFINGSGLPVSGVRILAGCVVGTGSVVAMIKNGSDYIVVDSLAGTAPGPQVLSQGWQATTFNATGHWTHGFDIGPLPTGCLVMLRANVRVDKPNGFEWRGTWYIGPSGSPTILGHAQDGKNDDGYFIAKTSAWDYLPPNTTRNYLHHVGSTGGGGGNATGYADNLVNRVDVAIFPGCNIAGGMLVHI